MHMQDAALFLAPFNCYSRYAGRVARCSFTGTACMEYLLSVNKHYLGSHLHFVSGSRTSLNIPGTHLTWFTVPLARLQIVQAYKCVRFIPRLYRVHVPVHAYTLNGCQFLLHICWRCCLVIHHHSTSHCCVDSHSVFFSLCSLNRFRCLN